MTQTSTLPSVHPPSDLDSNERVARLTRMVPRVRRMARSLARRLPQEVLVEDLEGAGNLGLVVAVERCQRLGESPCFEAFATQHIRGAMLNELRRLDPLTRPQRHRARQVEEATRRVADHEDGAVDSDQVAQAAGLSRTQYWEALCTVQHSSAVSLESLPDASRVTVSPGWGEHDELSTELRLDWARRWSRVREATQTLPERQRRVLELSVEQDMKICDIARLLGVSESRISQIRGEAIAQLRAHCVVPSISPPAVSPEPSALH